MVGFAGSVGGDGIVVTAVLRRWWRGWAARYQVPDEVMIKPPGENRTPLIEATFEDITLTLEAGRTVQWQSAAIHTYFSDPDNDTLEYRRDDGQRGRCRY